MYKGDESSVFDKLHLKCLLNIQEECQVGSWIYESRVQGRSRIER